MLEEQLWVDLCLSPTAVINPAWALKSSVVSLYRLRIFRNVRLTADALCLGRQSAFGMRRTVITRRTTAELISPPSLLSYVGALLHVRTTAIATVAH